MYLFIYFINNYQNILKVNLIDIFEEQSILIN